MHICKVMKDAVELVRHFWFVKGLINDITLELCLRYIKEDMNPFESEKIMRSICIKALEKRIVLDNSLIEKKYTNMTLLFAQESCDQELVKDETFDLLLKFCSLDTYNIESFRPLVYEYRTKIEEWTLTTILEMIHSDCLNSSIKFFSNLV